MTARKRDTKHSLNEQDDAPEWSDDVFARAEIAAGDKIVRPAQGTLTKRGRPPIGEATKQQVTLRLAPKVVEYFKAGGSGWQTRVNEVLERYVVGGSRVMPRAIQGVYAMAKNEKTSKKAGTAASKVLKSDSTAKNSKTAAGSALTQRPDKKHK